MKPKLASVLRRMAGKLDPALSGGLAGLPPFSAEHTTDIPSDCAAEDFAATVVPYLRRQGAIYKAAKSPSPKK